MWPDYMTCTDAPCRSRRAPASVSRLGLCYDHHEERVSTRRAQADARRAAREAEEAARREKRARLREAVEKCAEGNLSLLGSAEVPDRPGGYVYRLFASNGALVYVGVSDFPAKRIADHRARDWWPLVVEARVSAFRSYEDASEAESVAIVSEGPACNVQRPLGYVGRKAPTPVSEQTWRFA